MEDRMISFIKDYRLENIKKKFLILYLLNVTDILFTVILLQTGYFAEVNLLMVKAVQSPTASVLLKVLLPAALLVYIFWRIKKADSDQLKAANIAVNISLTIYTLVNLSHLLWFSMLPFLYLYQNR
jgi:hypothetical protein